MGRTPKILNVIRKNPGIHEITTARKDKIAVVDGMIKGKLTEIVTN